ncbi:MAG TPA: hypothetical protein VNM14_16765 [Planctomycetota bacterium]|jgi:hypothetical protein|nr:hypothetical protein [Planctomycetota bacterium]
MLKRQLLFFAILAAPVIFFSLRRPMFFSFLAIAAAGAWWAASPVSYPRWIQQGLLRALPLAGLETLALWFWSR